MGIKEFRERLGEVALGDEPIVLTHHGRRVGRYIPERTPVAPDLDVDAWMKARSDFGRRWRAATPNWRDILRGMGESEKDIAALEAEDRCS